MSQQQNPGKGHGQDKNKNDDDVLQRILTRLDGIETELKIVNQKLANLPQQSTPVTATRPQ